MAQYVVTNVSIKDQSQNQLDLGDYKAIEIDFTSPGLRQIDLTSSLGSFTGTYENRRFQIVFPGQNSAEIWGGPVGTQTTWKVVSKLDGNTITITIKDANGSNSIEEIQVSQDGTLWRKLNLVNNPSQVLISIKPGEGGGNGGFDPFGMKMLFKSTGNKVKMKKADEIHENGQRYNVNHEFKNYIMQGYFKLGSGQEKINHKGDGPNHGGCTSEEDFICLWYEFDINLSNGKFELQYEFPHNDNHDVDDSKCEHVETVGELKKGKWIGWACAYWSDVTGKRHMKAFVDKDPFDANGKPKNNWTEGLYAIEKGQIVSDVPIPRDLDKVINHDEAFESEIRMHRATEGDDDMKNCFVYEIIPPS
jgi:hypothetical protein